jgi:NAD(P)-dependent dehydrogenase (short-subunit alcohol dehydrogenase family)
MVEAANSTSVAGQNVVVTGAGQGIGRALATRFAADGARVIVNDLDATSAADVAAEIGGIALPGDASSAEGITALIDGATAQAGTIDVWVANAGIERGVGLFAPEEEWAQSLDVNLMAHVRAARLLVPEWEKRQSGRFVSVASAAGLLTMLGSAVYSVTKHGAVAFAEWLSATYRHQGIHVHTICPLGVNTRMLTDSGPLQKVLTRDPVLEPEDIAAALMEAIAEDRFLVLPHAQVRDYYAFRATRTDEWLGAMNHLQQQLESAMATD